MDIQFDFRTKLLVIAFTMSLVAVLTSDILIYTLMILLSVYLVLQGFGRQTVKYAIIYCIFIVLRLFSDENGITILMPEMFLFMVLRIMLMVMAAQPVIGMPPGEAVAVFKKIHAPDEIALPITFMLRFFPTIRSEFADVFASLRLRGLLSWKHPLDAAEYLITPVIFRSSRIAEELAASAESRGISNPGHHTCRRKIKFRKRDWAMCVIALIVTIAYFILERKVSL
ncbi:MAG: energy-coupling factor transporter transmembrane component T [Lachnospiraceae bacterium]